MDKNKELTYRLRISLHAVNFKLNYVKINNF